MIRQSQRLRRVLRKYALDARMARLNQAKAERERMALYATERRLVDARHALTRETGALNGCELAALGEWSARLDQAGIDLQPAIDRSNLASIEALQGMYQATNRVDRIEERISQTSRLEAREAESRSAPRRFGRYSKNATQT